MKEGDSGQTEGTSELATLGVISEAAIKFGKCFALPCPEGASPPQTPPLEIRGGSSKGGDCMWLRNRLELKWEVWMGEKWVVLTALWMVGAGGWYLGGISASCGAMVVMFGV